MNKKEDKFKFVTDEDLIGINKNVDNIEIVDVPKEVSVTKFDYEDDNILEEENNVSDKRYFSFLTRVIIMVTLIVILLGVAGLLIYKTIDYSKNDIVKYDEFSGNISRICLNDGVCLTDIDAYDSSLIKNIETTFDYNAKFSRDVDYNTKYHIVAHVTICDKADQSKILYTNDRLLYDTESVKTIGDTLSINKTITYDYLTDNDYVINYKDIYNGEYVGNVKIVLYLEEENEDREVSSVVIGFNSDNLELNKNTISNENKEVNSSSDTWDSYTIIFGIMVSTLIIISLILIYRVTRLVLKVTNNRTKYQQQLSQILREYDSIIVIARDGYESNKNRSIIKVDNFDKLLDIKDKLSKPIIFSKVNNVKCEFIVEDEDNLYKYVLKDEGV